MKTSKNLNLLLQLNLLIAVSLLLFSCNNTNDAIVDQPIHSSSDTSKVAPSKVDANKDTVKKIIVIDNKYILKSYNGKPVEGTYSFTLDKENNINARFCNSIFGLCILTGNQLKASDQLSSTQMACAEPEKMELEQAFTLALTEGVTMVNMGKQISLLNSKGVSFLFEKE